MRSAQRVIDLTRESTVFVGGVPHTGTTGDRANEEIPASKGDLSPGTG